MAQQDAANPLRKYTIRGLFGKGPFEIHLEPGGVSILTGANGTGKSTVLRTIDGFARGAWNSLSRLPFDSLSLKFERGPVIRVDKAEGGLKFTRGQEQWRYRRARTRSWAWAKTFETSRAAFPVFTVEDYETLEHADVWLERATREQPMPDVYVQAGENAPQPEWLTAAVADLTILFITDQRLVIQDRPHERAETISKESVRTAVSEYAVDLQRRIERAVGTYGDRAQELDRAFPTAVLRAMRKKKAPSEKRTFAALRALDEKREELERVGLARIVQ